MRRRAIPSPGRPRDEPAGPQPRIDPGPGPGRGRPARAGGLDRPRRSAADGPASGRRRPSVRLAWRALRRHWWQALLLWSAGSAGLMALAHDRVRPTFEASSAIRVDPGDRGPCRRRGPRRLRGLQGDPGPAGHQPRRDRLGPLGPPRAAPACPGWPRPRTPRPRSARSVVAAVVPGTNLIQVSMSSESADEAAEIVNAVIDAYLLVAPRPRRGGRRAACRRLREVQEERAAAVRPEAGGGRPAGRPDRLGRRRRARDRDSVTIEAYRVLTQQLLQARPRAGRGAGPARAAPGRAEGPGPGRPAGPRRRGGRRVLRQAREVAEVRSRLAKAREDLAQAGRIARDSGDPSRVAAKKRVDELQSQIDALWVKMRPSMLARPAGPRPAGRPSGTPPRPKVDGLKARLAQLNERLETLNARTRAAGADELTPGVRPPGPRPGRVGARRGHPEPRPGRVRGPGAGRPVPPGIPGPGVDRARGRPPAQGDGRGPGGDVPDGPRACSPWSSPGPAGWSTPRTSRAGSA